MVMGAMSVTASVNNSNNSQINSSQSSSIIKPQEIKTTSPTKGTSLTAKHTLEVREFLQTQNNTPLYTSAATPAKSLRNNFSSVISAVNPILFISQIVPIQQPAVTPVDSGNAADTSPTGPPSDTSTTTASGSDSGTTTGSDPTTAPGDSDSNPPPEKTPPSGSEDSGTPPNSSTLNMSQDPPPSSP